jgi:hypothetical protein
VVVVEPNSVVLELSEHPFPCSKVYANLFTEKVDDNTSTFNVALLYEFTEDADDETKTWFNNVNQGMISEMSNNVKEIFETDSYKQYDLKGYLIGSAPGKSSFLS